MNAPAHPVSLLPTLGARDLVSAGHKSYGGPTAGHVVAVYAHPVTPQIRTGGACPGPHRYVYTRATWRLSSTVQPPASCR